MNQNQEPLEEQETKVQESTTEVENQQTLTEENVPQQSEQKMIKLMTEKFMEKHWNDLDHKEVSLYQKMSVEFIAKHQSDIDFNLLSVNPFITFGILDRFSSRINWYNISINPKGLTNSLLFNYRNKILWNMYLSHHQLELRLLLDLSEVFRKSRAKNAKLFWSAISRYQRLDRVYLFTYRRYINFKELSKNPYLTDDIIDEFILDYDIPTLLQYHTISPGLMQKHLALLAPYIDNKTKPNE